MRFFLTVLLLLTHGAFAQEWKTDPIWHDGLVEKATYSASRPIYGKDRKYQAIFFTNKEQHDLRTLTKAQGSTQTVEVWKHHHVEVVPTPNYDYKLDTATHFTVDKFELTRLDFSSQEFCGTSFKQFLRSRNAGALDYWAFSYMPEAGRTAGTVDTAGRTVIPQDGLPLWLRDFDFKSRQPVRFWLLPTQKSIRPTPFEPVAAEVRFGGEEGETLKLEVHTFAAGGGGGDVYSRPPTLLGTFWMEKDSLHVMRRAVFADGQTYDLKSVERVDYWTIRGE